MLGPRFKEIIEEAPTGSETSASITSIAGGSLLSLTLKVIDWIVVSGSVFSVPPPRSVMESSIVLKFLSITGFLLLEWFCKVYQNRKEFLHKWSEF